MTSNDHQEIIRLFEELYPAPRVQAHLTVGRERIPYVTSVGAQKADWFICGTRPAILRMCKGNDVGCWCKVTEPCHGDTLLEISNPPSPQGSDTQ